MGGNQGVVGIYQQRNWTVWIKYVVLCNFITCVPVMLIVKSKESQHGLGLEKYLVNRLNVLSEIIRG